MLRIQIERKKLIDAIMYYADINEGLIPVIQDDSDLREWTLRCMGDWASEDDAAEMMISIVNDDVVIGGTNDVIDAIKQNVL